MAGLWKDHAFLAFFVISCLCLVALCFNLLISLFSKWTYKDKRDWIMILMLPLTIIFTFLEIAFSIVINATAGSNFYFHGLFYIEIFESLFAMASDLGLIILIPRIVAQQLQKMGETRMLQALKIFATVAWFIFLALEATNTGLIIYIDKRGMEFNRPFPIHIALSQYNVSFSTSFLYHIYILVIFGLSIKLFKRLKNEAASVIVLFVVLPFFLIAQLLQIIYLGKRAFSPLRKPPSHSLAYASNSVFIICTTIILICITAAGLLGRIRDRKLKKSQNYSGNMPQAAVYGGPNPQMYGQNQFGPSQPYYFNAQPQFYPNAQTQYYQNTQPSPHPNAQPQYSQNLQPQSHPNVQSQPWAYDSPNDPRSPAPQSQLQ